MKQVSYIGHGRTAEPPKEAFRGKKPILECRAAESRQEMDFCLAHAIKGMGLIKPDWATSKGKFPEFPTWTINIHNRKQEELYVRNWMGWTGLDKVIAFANKGSAAVSPQEAMDAIEKCSTAYPQASVQAHHRLPEFYVIAAMALAHKRFADMKMGEYAERTFYAMNTARSKATDPIHIPLLQEIMDAPQPREQQPEKILYFSDLFPEQRQAMVPIM